MKLGVGSLLLLVVGILTILQPSFRALHAQQCSDGIDNDADGGVDFLQLGNPDPTARAYFSSAQEIRSFVFSFPSLIDVNYAYQTSAQIGADPLTSQIVCNLRGFDHVASSTSVYWDQNGYGCHDYTIAVWNSSRGQFWMVKACEARKYLTTLECRGLLPACSDGRDNDFDGLADYPNDPGCANYSDASERPHDPQCSGPAATEVGLVYPGTNTGQCIVSDQSSNIYILSLLLKQMKNKATRLSAMLRRNAPSDTRLRDYAADARRAADRTYREGLEALQAIPFTIYDCPSNGRCYVEDYGFALGAFQQSALELNRLAHNVGDSIYYYSGQRKAARLMTSCDSKFGEAAALAPLVPTRSVICQ